MLRKVDKRGRGCKDTGGSAAAAVSRQTVSNCVVFCFLYVRRSELRGHRRSNFGNKITVYRRSLRSSRWKRNRLPRFPFPLSCLRSYPRRLLETNCLFSSIMARIFLSVLRRYVACSGEQKDDNFHENYSFPQHSPTLAHKNLKHIHLYLPHDLCITSGPASTRGIFIDIYFPSSSFGR